VFFNIDRVGDVPVTDGGSNFLNWCSVATITMVGCDVDSDGYFVRSRMGSMIDAYGHRYNYSPIDNQFRRDRTAYVKVYHTDANTWTIIPDTVPPHPGTARTASGR